MRYGIKVRLLSSFALILVLFFLAGIFAVREVAVLSDNARKISDHPLAVTRAVLEAKNGITAMHRSMKDVSTAVDAKERNKYVAIVDAYEKKAFKEINIIKTQILGARGRVLAHQFYEDFIKWRPIRKRVITLMNAGKAEKAGIITRGESDKYARFLTEKADIIRNYAAEQAAKLNEGIVGIANKTQKGFILIFLLTSLFGMGIALAISFSINSRLSILKEASKKIKAGDLKQTIKIKGNDEINDLSDNFNAMVTELSEWHEGLEKKVEERTKNLVLEIGARKKSTAELHKLKKDLEVKVSERTKELEERIKKADKSRKAMLYMVEDLNNISQELKVAQERMIRTERLATIGKLAGVVSHEIRNPLSVIRNSIYFLKLKLKKNMDKKVKKHLNILEAEIDTSDRIISDILGFARIKEPVPAELNINSIVKETLYKAKIPKDIKLKTSLKRNLPKVPLDVSQIKQVFSNMISNAVQAMTGGGKLEVVTTQEGRFVDIIFKDTGCGILEGDLGKIFEPLFSTKAKGIGLGLTICQTIVDGHKGKIEVESKIKKGTIFTIRLPVNEPKGKGEKHAKKG